MNRDSIYLLIKQHNFDKDFDQSSYDYICQFTSLTHAPSGTSNFLPHPTIYLSGVGVGVGVLDILKPVIGHGILAGSSLANCCGSLN